MSTDINRGEIWSVMWTGLAGKPRRVRKTYMKTKTARHQDAPFLFSIAS